MKKTAILLTAIVLATACDQKEKSQNGSNENAANLTNKEMAENFDWLTGKWKRLNEEAGMETFENWDKISATEYSGIGFTMQDGDTINQESMKIVQQDGQWNLLVKTPDEATFISFSLAELKKDTFTFTHDTLDFPNKINYWKNGENINALVAGEGMQIDFEFEKTD